MNGKAMTNQSPGVTSLSSWSRYRMTNEILSTRKENYAYENSVTAELTGLTEVGTHDVTVRIWQLTV